MAEMDYLDFDLQIEHADQGYLARVIDSPAGQASTEFKLPFSDLELENFVLRMSRPERGVRRLATPELEAARTFGGRLFEAVFAGEVRGALRSSLDAATEAGRGLRLRLRLAEAPELVDLPWEYLYSLALNRFFALSNATPIVRYLDLPERIPPLAVQPPLRLLALIASPHDYPQLDVEQEWNKLRGALQPLEDDGLIVLERLDLPTLSALQRRLRMQACHILHFVGHGAFDETTQDGLLLLEDEGGRGRAVSAQDLGVLLHDHQSLRLVVLNSCEGGRTSRLDPFAGAAQSLVQQGIPAVVAMQFEISDDAAIAISHEFYSSLAAGYPVDAALAEARKAAFTGGSGAEWGTPVLYLRAADGRIFGVKAPATPTRPAAVILPAAVIRPPTRMAAPESVRPVEGSAVPAAPESASAEKPRALSARATGGELISRRRWWFALAGLVAVVVLGFAVSKLLPTVPAKPGPEATSVANGPTSPSDANASAPTAEVTAQGAGEVLAGSVTVTLAPGAGAAVTPGSGLPLDKLLQAKPRVLSSTAWVHDLIPATDGVWAATSGGLVRWKADGTSTVYTAADGLPFNQTRALLALPDGSLWAAGDYSAVHITPAGDGLGQIQKYSDDEGLDLSEVPVFMLDGDGSIWIASHYGQPPIYRFAGALWRPPALPSDDPALQGVQGKITALLRSQDGALWVGLSQDGILRWNGKAWTRFGAEQGVPGKSIERLLQDRAGVLWAAAGEGGLLRFDPAAGRWSGVELQRADAPVYSIAQLPDGSVWASSDNFISRSTDGGKSWALIASAGDSLYFPSAVVQDAAGRVWVATRNGLGVYDGGQWRTWRRPDEPATYDPAQLFGAPDGRLWVLPEYGGTPSAIDPGTGDITLPAPWSQDGTNVTALAFAGDTTWAGTSAGLMRLKGGAQRRFVQADGLPDDFVSALVATPSTLWIGTRAGLAGYDLASDQITGTVEALAGHAVDSLLVAPDGALWVGSHWGEDGANSAVERFAGSEPRIWPNDQAPLEGNGKWVHALVADGQGGIWVAHNNGVHRWDGQSWLGWSGGQGAPANDVFALLAYGSEMWAAGRGGSLYRWNQDGWQRIRPMGLTGNVLAMHVSGDGALWLATDDGLLRYGP